MSALNAIPSKLSWHSEPCLISAPHQPVHMQYCESACDKADGSLLIAWPSAPVMHVLSSIHFDACVMMHMPWCIYLTASLALIPLCMSRNVPTI